MTYIPYRSKPLIVLALTLTTVVPHAKTEGTHTSGHSRLDTPFINQAKQKIKEQEELLNKQANTLKNTLAQLFYHVQNASFAKDNRTVIHNIMNRYQQLKTSKRLYHDFLDSLSAEQMATLLTILNFQNAYHDYDTDIRTVLAYLEPYLSNYDNTKDIPQSHLSFMKAVINTVKAGLGMTPQPEISRFSPSLPTEPSVATRVPETRLDDKTREKSIRGTKLIPLPRVKGLQEALELNR